MTVPVLAVAALLVAAEANAQGVDATDETSAAPAEGSAELQQIEARRRALFQLMLADPSNLDVAFEYAGLSARAGDIEAAISTLERMLIFAPGLPRLQLELGVLYFRLGANETARSYFQSALAAPDVPDVVKARVDPYLAAINERTKGYQFHGLMSGGIRYQTNANAAPGSRSITLFGLPFVLDDEATGQPDLNSFVSGNFHYSLDLQNQGDTFDANLLTYGAWYQTREEINTALAEVKFGPVIDLERFGLNNSSLGIHALLSGLMLGTDPYLGAAGAGANFATLITPRTRLLLQPEYRREEYLDSGIRPTASLRSGHLITGTARLQHQLTDRFSIFGSLDGERRYTERDYLDLWEWGGTAGWVLAMESWNVKQREPWTVGLTGGYMRRDYDAPDVTIDPTAAERDEEKFIVGTFTLPFFGGWALQAQSGYRDVTSNYVTRVFDNVHGSLAVQKRF